MATKERFFVKRTMAQGEMNVMKARERLDFLMQSKRNNIGLVSLCKVRNE